MDSLPPAASRSVASDTRRFFLLIAALVAALLVLGAARWFVNVRLHEPAVERGILFARAVTDLHQSMLDQETGLRGYQITADPHFREPYERGQSAFLAASSRAWRLAPTEDLEDRLRVLADRAHAWQVQYAVPQIAATAAGSPGPPDDASLLAGKELFDAYREPYEGLLLAARTSNTRHLEERRRLDQATSLLEVGLAALALLVSWRRWRRVDGDLARPVEEVVQVLQRLSEGDERARPVDYPVVEFSRLSHGVRTLAEAAQRRREEADGQRAAAAARLRIYREVLGVSQELSAYVDARQLAQALLQALHRVAGVDRAVLLAVDGCQPGEPLGLLGTQSPLPLDPAADESLRFLRLVRSDDGRRCSVPVVHGGSVHALLVLEADQVLEEHGLLAVENLVLAAAAALTAVHLHEQVHAESRSDALTGLHNRRRFEEDLQQELGLLGRTGVPVSLLLLDVDHFKRFNDQHGHREGDRLLAQLAGVLALGVRSSDSVYRYGGEELAVLARGTTGPDAVLLAERLRALVAGRTGVTVSIGVATVDRDLGPDLFLESADRALYEAKRAGRAAGGARRRGRSPRGR